MKYNGYIYSCQVLGKNHMSIRAFLTHNPLENYLKKTYSYAFCGTNKY